MIEDHSPAVDHLDSARLPYRRPWEDDNRLGSASKALAVLYFLRRAVARSLLLTLWLWKAALQQVRYLSPQLSFHEGFVGSARGLRILSALVEMFLGKRISDFSPSIDHSRSSGRCTSATTRISRVGNITLKADETPIPFQHDTFCKLSDDTRAHDLGLDKKMQWRY